MDTPVRDCPKCQGAMVVRLGELECTKCGHFEPFDGIPASQGRLRLGAASIGSNDEPGSRRSFRMFADANPGRRLAVEKTCYLVIFFLIITVGNLLLRGEYKQVASLELELNHVIIGGSIVTLLVALVLFIDWRGIKVFAIVIAALFLLLYFFSLFSAWNGKSQLIIVKLFVDTMLIGWLVSLFARDIRRS